MYIYYSFGHLSATSVHDERQTAKVKIKECKNLHLLFVYKQKKEI